MLGLFRPYIKVLVRGRGDRVRFVALLAVLFIAALFEAVGVGLVLPFIKLLQEPSFADRIPGLRSLSGALGARSPTDVVLVAGAALIVIFVAKGVYLAAASAAQMRFIYTRMSVVSAELLARYLHKPYTYHTGTNSAEVVRNVIADTSHVFTYSMVSLFVIVVEAMTVFAVGGLLVTLEPFAVPIAGILMGAIMLGMQRALVKRTVALGVAARADEASMVQWANEALGGIKEILVRNCQDYFIDRFAAATRARASALRKYRVIQLLPRYVLETMGIVGLVGVTAIVLLRGEDPRRLIPLLGTLAVAVVRILPSLARISGSLTEVRHSSAAISNIESELAKATTSDLVGACSKTMTFEREIALRDVTVTYTDAATPAISHVSCNIKKGEAVALVGPSGAGKTTLADVLIGLIAPSSGTVTVDGDVVDDRTRRSWQACVGYIPQVVYLTDESMRQNIAFGVGREAFDEKRLAAAVKAAQLEGVVRDAPGGLDARVGERGVRLSGGQRQRVGIARVLYLDAKLLVLDEATSALDGVTEREIVEAIDRLKGQRTIVIIAHRLSTVRSCDRIIHMDGGRVIGDGTWTDLETRSQSFRTLLAAVSTHQ